ncbi:efflux RND transporter periplasmic adaptor subunit [Desulfatitalea alkaliphila]|uniref:Efflux RND transporter periplasmic adaptor subunit n=1 Tax=Desulfatitalea alkaliphila TaxID=2929485 RepID=A0AA41R523_9BACT|nr:efflux RND transporter periplasmic adaptor subunit [Desulfatitalea alkaliphila]MCJ8502984.1 efflux RND transporter periplasmic adaptor subunit [Desulfatitalea alkaliphila]
MNQSVGKKQPLLSVKQKAVVLLVVLLTGAWIGIKAAARLQVALDPPAPEETAPPAVATMRLSLQPFERWQRYPGTIAAEREAVLQSRLTARIVALPVRTGQVVRHGDLLVRLDDEELGREIERLQAAQRAVATELALSEKLLQRRRQLFAASAATEEQVDEARTRVEALQAAREENRQALRVAETRRGYARIEAPFDGVVGHLFVFTGDMAAPGRALVELIDTSTVKVVFAIAQKDVPQIAQGTPAEIHVSILDRVMRGQVDRIHPALQTPGRGALAEIVLPAGSGHPPPGMEAVVRLRIFQRDRVLVLPVEAVHRRDAERYVFTVEKDVARRRPVTTGPEYQGRVVIETGLAPGDEVILTPHPALVDGVAVTIGDRP